MIMRPHGKIKRDAVIIVLAWLMALALLYLVFIKIKIMVSFLK